MEDGAFSEGQKVSVNRKTKEMRLSTTKYQIDGTKIEKIEHYSKKGIKSGFYVNGSRVSDIISRLNCVEKKSDWFSIKPKGSKYYMKN